MYTIGKEQINSIEEVLGKDFIDGGVQCAVLIDVAGNVVVERDNGVVKHDIYALAALAAGNFGAITEMAKIIGEGEFALLFHKGKEKSIHFSRVTDDFLLITIFGHEMSLGFLRLKVAELIGKIEKIL